LVLRLPGQWARAGTLRPLAVARASGPTLDKGIPCFGVKPRLQFGLQFTAVHPNSSECAPPHWPAAWMPTNLC